MYQCIYNMLYLYNIYVYVYVYVYYIYICSLFLFLFLFLFLYLYLYLLIYANDHQFYCRYMYIIYNCQRVKIIIVRMLIPVTCISCCVQSVCHMLTQRRVNIGPVSPCVRPLLSLYIYIYTYNASSSPSARRQLCGFGAKYGHISHV